MGEPATHALGHDDIISSPSTPYMPGAFPPAQGCRDGCGDDEPYLDYLIPLRGRSFAVAVVQGVQVDACPPLHQLDSIISSASFWAPFSALWKAARQLTNKRALSILSWVLVADSEKLPPCLLGCRQERP
ncbi:hypothetical protein VFPPC_17551 [Pochonia chlamydosporia 170]|uniref:Uncharacterized protein n=1 Tax=Pochonia chlamydosporia 170 TaxID=1380566 RepID=A0A219AR95_METCM|nr:hypothetical protein VFPPC_17551 [Pochonia chlamydosporia 170]OWT43286.1 hypothetical protein VFPPC_17551 [Pochonia chlamydosporia 170]